MTFVSAPLRRASPVLLPILALTSNALVWGTSWWPFRRMEAAGLHPLWGTAFVFALAAAAIIAVRPRSVAQVLRTPALWVLVLASGTTNAAFNWAVVIGDVVRVVLLFYLMPLWAVLLARLLLNERLSRLAALRVMLGLAGAAIVLWPEGAGLPIPHSLADWLGVVGGFTFALNNVMLRREADSPEEGRALAMFLGGALVAGTLAIGLSLGDPAFRPPGFNAGWLVPALGLSVVFLVSNLALQYGAARLPANLTAVVMLTEVVFAAVSAVALGAGVLTVRLVVGGTLIVAGAMLAAFGRRAPH
jgi:drug/metabolite transporter (DMT)-like permease